MGSPGSRRLVANALFCVSLFVVASALFALGDQDVDPDLFWHLRVAELIEATGPQPLVDTFSYNSTPWPWIPYSWLAELGMRRAMESLGTLALSLVPLLCYLATLLFVTLAVIGRTGRSLKAASVVTVVALLILPFIGFRPATFAFPVCAFAVWAVSRASRRRGGVLAVAALVPLTAFLANVHLFFLFPPILILAWGVGEWLEGRATGRGARRAALAYLSLAAICLALAFAANPFGTRLFSVIAHYLLDDVMVTGGVIVEMRPFYSLGPLPLWGTLLLLAWPMAGWARRRVRPDWRDLASFALALALVLSHGRYIPLAAALLAPLAAAWGPWPRLSAVGSRRLSALAVGLVLGLAASAALRVSRTPPERDLDRYLQSRTSYPVAAARFVQQAVPRGSGRLINEMGWGGYLIYTLWPDFQVMMDGRTLVYPERLWRAAYVDATPESRLDLLRQAQADAAVLAVDSEWAAILENDLGWHRVYVDEVAGVWVPEAARPLTTRSTPKRAGDPY